MRGNGSPKKRKSRKALSLYIPIKPLSTNKMYSGRKRRSIYYKQFSREVTKYLENVYDLRNLALAGKLRLKLEVGVSSPLMDASNCIKAIEDVLVKYCGTWDDRQIFSLNVEKYLVPKGAEYMKISITKLRGNRDLRKKLKNK